MMANAIPGPREKCSASSRNRCSPSSRNRVRNHPGMPFGFIPESRSPSPGIRRKMAMVPLKIKDGHEIRLSAGEHSTLIKRIIEDFAPRFIAGGRLIYVGDTGDKYGYFEVELLPNLNVHLDHHGKLPDVVIYSK